MNSSIHSEESEVSERTSKLSGTTGCNLTAPETPQATGDSNAGSWSADIGLGGNPEGGRMLRKFWRKKEKFNVRKY